MNRERLRESFASKLSVFVVVYLLLALLMYWVVSDDWSVKSVKTDYISMGYLLPAGAETSQTLHLDMDGLESVTIAPHFDQPERTGNVTFAILDNETVLWTTDLPAAELTTDQLCTVAINPPLRTSSDLLTLKVIPNETGMALWAGNTINTGKFDISVQTSGIMVNGEPYDGSFVLSADGYEVLQASQWFWPVCLLGLVGCIAVGCIMHDHISKGKNTIATKLVTVWKQYNYLLRQLVWRDFRVKYKSSMLGMLWSFLNPLLTMLVYYFVFSTLFKSDVEFFQVYLMSGIILFSYMSESTSLGLSSIIDNSTLITKVYMPKVICPLSKVCSSAINLCISFIPLFFVMLISGVPLSKSMLLIPVVVIFLVVFCLGVSLLLATMYVFFRDMKFLWGVVLTMWNFLTPIFYPESIIAQEVIGIYRCNPMYQIVTFMRTIILDGVAPAPESWLYCLLSAGIPLLLGLWAFKRNQDRFVLYL